MCSMEQVKAENQKNAFSKLVSYENTNKTEGPLTDEDIKTGYRLFHAIVYCPPTLELKLFRFVDELLSSESQRTIIQTFVNLFQSGLLKDSTSFTLATQFYSVFAKTLNLQHGNILVRTSTKSQLQAVIENNWPFLPSVSTSDEIQDIFRKLCRYLFQIRIW